MYYWKSCFVYFSGTEAVKLLPTLDIENELNIKLVTIKEVPVVYDYVQNNIPELWKTYKPKVIFILKLFFLKLNIVKSGIFSS